MKSLIIAAAVVLPMTTTAVLADSIDSFNWSYGYSQPKANEGPQASKMSARNDSLTAHNNSAYQQMVDTPIFNGNG
ncbi:MAG: hypothetical protein AB7F35_16705 [Acetobacteraceae bacterium]